MSTLARVGDDDLKRLWARVNELEALLDARAAEVAQVKANLQVFRLEYRTQVGSLHEQLDELEAAIAEGELGYLTDRLKDAVPAEAEPPDGAGPEPPPRFKSDAVRKLFRDVAKAIHPDLTRDEAARIRRQALMAQANRAYALGDEEQLRRILESWDRSPEAVPEDAPDGRRARLERRIAQINEELNALAAALADLQGSPLGRLKTMVDEAAADGKDLVRGMVARLKRDILVARNRLDAMRPPV